MIPFFTRYFSRPKARRPVRKPAAIMLTLVGLFAIVLAVWMIATAWADLSWADRVFWLASITVSLWMLPWTWANFFRDHTKI